MLKKLLGPSICRMGIVYALVAFVSATSGFAYEVWIGTNCAPKNAALHPETWSTAAKCVEGVNMNFAPCLPTPGTPCENEVRCSTADWKLIVKQFAHKSSAIMEMPRSEFASVPHPTRTLAQALEDKIKTAASYGFELGTLLFYDNRTGDPPVLYTWTVAEVQAIRDWLDANGHADVGLMWNARNNLQASRAWCVHSLVDDVMLESGPDGWYDNLGQRHELLKFLWTDKRVANKRLVFQIPVTGKPYGTPDGYQQVRRLVRWMGTDLMGWEFMHSSRVIFLPVSYNSPTYTFYPDMAAPNRYANTLTSLALSMIEQRDLFEGRKQIPTVADADSYVRRLNAIEPRVWAGYQ